jgi:Trk K+ transport system NAD-binding subunit
MTGSLSHLVSLIIASSAAYAVAEALKAKPIYEAFLDRLLSKGRISRVKYEERERKIVLSVPVCSGSFLEHRRVRELTLPPECVLVGVLRGKHEKLPHPETVLQSGDALSVLTEESRAAELKPVLLQLGAPDSSE